MVGVSELAFTAFGGDILTPAGNFGPIGASKLPCPDSAMPVYQFCHARLSIAGFNGCLSAHNAAWYHLRNPAHIAYITSASS
jgi:hypothetical protein